ncbi:MAG: voltage-gated chloride channel protein [Chitinophagaceae bacterium]|nr:MAG: voltage-gated chloride channel protein [Chitinophagaceae bacterium]
MILILPVAIVTGASVALFLWLMEVVNAVRWNNMWLIFFLPAAGVLIAWMYKRAGSRVEAGNDLVIDEIHSPQAGVPARITPLIFVTTLITHLFGGSAGREGTAVQMGGGISGYFATRFNLSSPQVSALLMCGMAAGFGAVFGTPLAGAVFAIEVLVAGRLRHRAFLPCLFAAVGGDLVVRLTGVHHTTYQVLFVPAGDGFFRWISADVMLPVKIIAAGIFFGYASRLYIVVSRLVKTAAVSVIVNPLLRPVVGGMLVILISYITGSFDYLGLGVTNPDPGGVSILSAFEAGGAENFSWFWKLLLTAITLGFGFKGGEVTPLFFIGATLGNVLAGVMGLPVDLLAAAGFLAVFAGATNTPLACTIMGIELFGSDNFIFFALACFTAYFFSGRRGIYSSQRLAGPPFV